MATNMTDGMEPAMVGNHAKALTAHAQTLTGTAARARQVVASLGWRGRDRDQFVERSTALFGKDADRIAAALTQRAKRLDAEIAKQVETSSS